MGRARASVKEDQETISDLELHILGEVESGYQ